MVDIDDGDGNTCQMALSNGQGACSLVSTGAGPKTLTASYRGDDNFNPSNGIAGHTVNKAGTITAITTSAPEPSVAGQTYTITASITAQPPGVGTPGGTVEVDDGDGNTCQMALSGGQGVCSLASTSAGPKTLTASYGGDTDFNPSSSTAQHIVNKAATTTSITTDLPDPSVVGQAYTITASVTAQAPGAGAPDGVVDIDDGSGNTCQITLSNGQGACSLVSTGPGLKTLTASYGGSTSFNPSSGTAQHTVDKIDTTTAILADLPDPSVIGQPYTITASVTAQPPGAGTPGGTIDIDDGGGNTCQATLSNGQGACSLVSIAAGPKTLTVSYRGSASFNSSNGTAQHTVNEILPLEPPLVLTPAEGALSAGAQANWPIFSGSAGPGLTVTVMEGDAILCASTAGADGSWQCASQVMLASGPHTISVTAASTDGRLSLPTLRTFIVPFFRHLPLICKPEQ